MAGPFTYTLKLLFSIICVTSSLDADIGLTGQGGHIGQGNWATELAGVRFD